MKMKNSLSLLFFIAIILSATFSAYVPIAKAVATTSAIVLAYYTNISGIDLNTYGSKLTQVSMDTENTDINGNLVGSVPTEAVSYANNHGLVSYALVSNYNDATGGWDSEVAHTVMTDAAAKSNLINNMLNLLKTNHYKGINIDFEGILGTDGANFTSFVHDVAAIMHQNNLLTMVSVPPKSKDDPVDTWASPFDFTSLGKDVDLLQVMTYDEYGIWSGPGPVVSTSLITKALNYAISHVSPQKILMGIPAYGNDWNLSDATGKSNRLIYWKNIPKLIFDNNATPVRDAVSGSMHFTYILNGNNHEVWYEDATSIAQKTNYTISYGLAGVSVYSLGEGDANFWNAIHAGLSGTTPAGLSNSSEPSPNKPVFNEKVVNAKAVKEMVTNAIQKTPVVEFKDVSKSNWSAFAVETAAKIGFVNGYEDGTFHPEAKITRAEFATILVKALGLKNTGNDSFADTKGHWAAESINALKSSGIAGGYNDGTFKPDQENSRAEIVTMLAKVMNLDKVSTIGKFSDVRGHWAEQSINALANAGIVSGNGTGAFDPNVTASREESVVMILRMLNVNLDLGLNL
jgi:spore germination protein YaaH